MTKGAPKAAAAAPKQPEPPQEPAESWKPGWSIERRMLEARRRLKGTQLWKTFEGDRDFEAFSIHTLANGVEEVLGDCGVISSFSITRWQKSGNTTWVEGLIRCTAVDGDKGVLEYVCVGEGVDDSDKGMGKAVSYARKIGMVSALNLGIGADNEATRAKAAPQPQPTGGSPQQGAQPHTTHHGANGSGNPKPSMNDFINGSEPAQPAQSQKMYTFQVKGLKARGVLTQGMQQEVWNVVSNSPTTEALDEWVNLNTEMLNEFSRDNPAIAGAMKKIFDARRSQLSEKGL
jgi:hypothetical protein